MKSRFERNTDLMRIDVFEKIKHINFVGFERKTLKNALTLYDISIKTTPQIPKNNTKGAILANLKAHAQYSMAKYSLKDGGGKILFVYSHEFYREDSWKKLHQVMNLIENCDLIFAEKESVPYNRQRVLMNCLRYFAWWCQMIGTSLKLQEKLFAISYIAAIYNASREILSLVESNKKSYRLTVFYFDAGPIESVVEQTLQNKYQMECATLQHSMCLPASLSASLEPTMQNAIFSLNQNHP